MPDVVTADKASPQSIDKPGWQTTEFWITVAMQVISILAVTGVVKPGDAATIQGAVSQAVTGAFALIASALTIWKYIEARKAVKVTTVQAAASVMRTGEMTSSAMMMASRQPPQPCPPTPNVP